MEKHINIISSKISRAIYGINRMKHFLPHIALCIMRAVMHLAQTARPAFQTTILVESVAFARLDGRVGFVKVSVMDAYSFQAAEFGGFTTF